MLCLQKNLQPHIRWCRVCPWSWWGRIWSRNGLPKDNLSNRLSEFAIPDHEFLISFLKKNDRPWLWKTWPLTDLGFLRHHTQPHSLAQSWKRSGPQFESYLEKNTGSFSSIFRVLTQMNGGGFKNEKKAKVKKSCGASPQSQIDPFFDASSLFFFFSMEARTIYFFFPLSLTLSTWLLRTTLAHHWCILIVQWRQDRGYTKHSTNKWHVLQRDFKRL